MRKATAGMTSSLLLLIVATANCGPLSGGVSARRPFQIDVPDLAGLTRATVHTSNGAIEVQVDEKASVATVRGEKWIQEATQQDADNRVDEIVVTAEREGADTLAVRVKLPARDNYGNGGASVVLVLPRSMPLTLETSNGAISVKANQAALEAVTSNGAIDVKDAAGQVQATTSNGSIKLTRIEGDVIARTSNGSFVATEIHGSVKCETNNGSIHVAANPPPAGHVDVVTSNASIDLQVPSTFGAKVSLSTSNGGIKADTAGFKAESVTSDKGRYQATLNDGTGLIRGHTSNARIAFRGA